MVAGVLLYRVFLIVMEIPVGGALLAGWVWGQRGSVGPTGGPGGRMRILHVTDHYPPVLGGIETHVATLAARQAARGDEVIVLTSTPPRPTAGTASTRAR